jgi:hypothetical protein
MVCVLSCLLTVVYHVVAHVVVLREKELSLEVSEKKRGKKATNAPTST